MALIRCPECGKQISDKAKCCPNCGFVESYSPQTVSIQDFILKKPSALIMIIIIVFCTMFFIKLNDTKMLNNMYNKSSYYSTSQTKVNASTIFKNLSITNFSASLGKHAGSMTCRVKNNNSFTINGYFYVNFYDKNGKLMYSQLMSLPSIESGDTVTCSNPIPKDEYPIGYSYVDYSQASLIKE